MELLKGVRNIVMVHFMCQPVWVIGCPDSWSNIILVCLGGCFWMRLMFKLVD